MTREAHLCQRRRPSASVCGRTRPALVVTTSPDLLAHATPCPRCLEWVVEQGQLASRRLEESETTTRVDP